MAAEQQQPACGNWPERPGSRAQIGAGHRHWHGGQWHYNNKHCSLDNAGVDRQTYEDPCCGNTKPHDQHYYSPMASMTVNCPGVAAKTEKAGGVVAAIRGAVDRGGWQVYESGGAGAMAEVIAGALERGGWLRRESE